MLIYSLLVLLSNSLPSLANHANVFDVYSLMVVLRIVALCA